MLVQFAKLLKRPKNSIYAGTHEIAQNTTKNNIKWSNSLIKEQYIWWYKTQNYSKFPGTVYIAIIFFNGHKNVERLVFFLAARLVVFEVLVLQAQGAFLQSVKSSLEIFPQTFFFVSHFGLFSSRWQWIMACTNCDNNGNSCGSG